MNAYIHFSGEQLKDLTYSLHKEVIHTNDAGSYSSFSLAGSNTRKYHGLLVVPQPQIDPDNHILLSGLDEELLFKTSDPVLLGSRQYPGVRFPEGHIHLEYYELNPVSLFIYSGEHFRLEKEFLLMKKENRIIVRYRLVEASEEIQLRLRPYLAFRNIHHLSKFHAGINKKVGKAKNGTIMRLYPEYEDLYMQCSKKPDVVVAPDWYYKVEYFKEMERGYECHEDLFSPGFFECSLKVGEEIYFSAGTQVAKPSALKKEFKAEKEAKRSRNTFLECLQNAAEQFIARDNTYPEIISGYHWFGRWGRDTFVSLPGLLLSRGDFDTFHAVLEGMLKKMNGPLFPNFGQGRKATFNSVDAPLWFIWSIHQFLIISDDIDLVYKKYYPVIKTILKSYKDGTYYNIRMEENGLLHCGEYGEAVTWMDAKVNNRPVTPRLGYPVEVNALWYNAINLALDIAEEYEDNAFLDEWEKLPVPLARNFEKNFWSDEKGFLADFAYSDYQDWSIRPNQLFAVSLPFSPLDDYQQEKVFQTVKKNLLTEKGLRSLSPDNPRYKGVYFGNQFDRDAAYHQGTVWPWLLGAYADACIRVNGSAAAEELKKVFKGIEKCMFEGGLSTLSEIYDGDPPHWSRGSISQAWSVAEVLRLKYLLDQFEKS